MTPQEISQLRSLLFKFQRDIGNSTDDEMEWAAAEKAIGYILDLTKGNRALP